MDGGVIILVAFDMKQVEASWMKRVQVEKARSDVKVGQIVGHGSDVSL